VSNDRLEEGVNQLSREFNSLAAWRFAVQTRPDVIAHGMWNWDEAEQPGQKLPAPIRAVLDTIVARRIAFMPTLRVIEGLGALFDLAFLDGAGGCCCAEVYRGEGSAEGGVCAESVAELGGGVEKVQATRREPPRGNRGSMPTSPRQDPPARI
jgi:hypothetical protein